MKAILMAAGSGSRLYPLTFSTSKHLLPIYDKPLIYYPLSVLMLAGIKDILIIVNKEHESNYKKLLSKGAHLGLRISYKIQQKPNGIAGAFSLSEDFIGKSRFCIILGDNFFWGDGLYKKLMLAKTSKEKNIIFSYWIDNPKDFAVISNNENKISIIEKPKIPQSNNIVTGLYFYENNAIKIAKKLKPSKRNELEITDINNYYCKRNMTKIIKLGRGFAWFDCGTHENILKSSFFVESIEKRQGLKIACLEETAYLKKWISKDQIKILIKKYDNNSYARYLLNLIN